MPNLTLKNIPDGLYEEFKQFAAANHRSINSQMIALMEQTLRSQIINPDEFLARARALREKTAHYLITDEEINEAKTEGRQ